MRLVYPGDYGADPNFSRGPHEYFFHDSRTPVWYKDEIKGAGRRFEFQPKGYHYPGELIFDEESNFVYVKLIFS
jgi:hypothetical protein